MHSPAADVREPGVSPSVCSKHATVVMIDETPRGPGVAKSKFEEAVEAKDPIESLLSAVPVDPVDVRAEFIVD